MSATSRSAKALLASLFDLKTMGDAHAVIGRIDPSTVYENPVGAMPIPNAALGTCGDMLKIDD